MLPVKSPLDSTARPEVAIPVRLPGELRRRIGAMARRTGRSAAELITLGVADYLSHLERKLATSDLITAGAKVPETDAVPLDRFLESLTPEETFSHTRSWPPRPAVAVR